MDYKLLNKKLVNFYNLRMGKPTESTRTEFDEDDICQGERPEWYEVYPFDGDVYIKFYMSTDSYGDEERIDGIEFVSPQQVKVTNFVAI